MTDLKLVLWLFLFVLGFFGGEGCFLFGWVFGGGLGFWFFFLVLTAALCGMCLDAAM